MVLSPTVLVRSRVKFIFLLLLLFLTIQVLLFALLFHDPEGISHGLRNHRHINCVTFLGSHDAIFKMVMAANTHIVNLNVHISPKQLKSY